METKMDCDGRTENASKTKKKLIVRLERLVLKKGSKFTTINGRENRKLTCENCNAPICSDKVLDSHTCVRKKSSEMTKLEHLNKIIMESNHDEQKPYNCLICGNNF